MSGEPRRTYEPFVLRPASSADPASPVNYVRSFLGKRLCLVLMDERILVGVFCCLDYKGMMCLTEAVEHAGDHRRTLGKAIVPLELVQAMELREP
jgi:hypothetical protein